MSDAEIYTAEQLTAYADHLQELVEGVVEATALAGTKRRPSADWINRQRMTIWALRTSAQALEIVDRAVTEAATSNGLVLHPSIMTTVRAAALQEFLGRER